jgi:hypothetical protein
MASVPEEFLCPITLVVMTDPVMGSDGRTYERAAIVRWLQTNPFSPLTRQPMTIQSLKPNYALRSAIERHRSPRPTASAPPPQPDYNSYAAMPVQPSAPPGDHYFAIQVYQQDLNQQLLLRPIVTPQTQTAQDVQRKKLMVACLCVSFIIVIFVIVFRLADFSS